MSATYQLIPSMHDAAGNFFQNVFHYELSEAGTGLEYDYAADLIDAWDTGVGGDFAGMLGNDVTIDFISAKRITGIGGVSATTIVGSGGLGPNNSLCSAFAADIAWYTAAASNRPGHTFMGGVYAGAIINGQWDAAYINLANAFIASMLTQLTLAHGRGTADFGLFTRKTNTFNVAKSGVLKVKPSGFNKRTLPLI